MTGTRISNVWGKIILFFVICCFGTGGLCVNNALALDGSGTEGDPWLIQSLEDFNDFAADANYWDDYTRLETDVNLAGMVYDRAVIAPDINNSNWWFDGTAFTGVFDGNDHKITNMTIDDGGTGNDFLSLIGFIVDGEVSALGLEGGSISGEDYVSGLVGYNKEGSVSNCYSTGSVSGVSGVSGLVVVNVGSISNCYSTGNVNGYDYVGGVVGWNQAGNISNCYSTGDVSGVESVGGLVGLNSGSISPGNISNCYSIGDVSGVESVGGVVGLNTSASVSNCFWDTNTQTHGVNESIGQNYGTVTNVLGLPTYQLHQQSTFTNWDFINVWNIGENQTYPYLRVYVAGDINKDGIVNFLDIAITANQWLEGVE